MARAPLPMDQISVQGKEWVYSSQSWELSQGLLSACKLANEIQADSTKWTGQFLCTLGHLNHLTINLTSVFRVFFNMQSWQILGGAMPQVAQSSNNLTELTHGPRTPRPTINCSWMNIIQLAMGTPEAFCPTGIDGSMDESCFRGIGMKPDVFGNIAES